MNSWRSRLAVGLLIFVAMWAHSYATWDLPNSPLGLLVFHGSAALVDFALLLTVPVWLAGSVCDDSETLMLLSIIGNAAGWGLYMAYAPPVFYDVYMWGLSIAQMVRLLYVDKRDANSMGWDLVRRHHRGGY